MSESARPAKKPRVFLRLLWMLRPQWPMAGTGLLLLLLSIPCELFAPLMWLYVTDYLIVEQQTAWTTWLHFLVSFNGSIENKIPLLLSAMGWMFAVYGIGEVFGTVSNNLMNRVAQKFIMNLRNEMYHKLQGQSLGYLQRQRTGDLMSRAISDVDELQSFIVNGIDQIVGEGLLWVTTVIIVMSMDWQVAGASLAPLLLVYVLLRLFNSWIGPIYRAARERAGDVSARLQENLSGVVVIKIFGREKEEATRFEGATREYYHQQIRGINARSIFFPFTRGVGFLSNIFMIGIGGYSILTDGGFTLGKMLAFSRYWWRLYGPVMTLARVNDMVQRALAAGRRVFEVLDAPEELPDAPGAVPVDQVRGAMELRGVSFSYGPDAAGGQPREGESSDGDPAGNSAPSGRRPPVVLHDVSIQIEPGQTVALCGPSGAGKSTVLNLLLRFYDPAKGTVRLDGRDVRSITRESFRRQFALVQQETFLFNDSIVDNIRYGHPEATMEQVIAAAKAANAHGFITSLPQGYETRVGERGVRLSGGQKQRLSIARAFLANPTVLLLDEPTSSVEPDSEAAIIAALDRLMTGRTTVLTSHRPSLINQAERVYVIEDGRVSEQGTVEQLKANGGWFSRFMRSAEGVEVGE